MLHKGPTQEYNKNMNTLSHNVIWKVLIVVAVLVIILVLLLGGKKAPRDGDATFELLASVGSVEALTGESFPVEVEIVAKGDFSDSCGVLGSEFVTRSGNHFTIEIPETRGGEVCAQVVTPWEKKVLLNVLNLEAGVYTVEVNGITTEFELYVDNQLDYTGDKG